MGKSSLLKVFAGLWRPSEGQVARPPIMRGSFFVPQTSYATEGTLLEQVLYPQQAADAHVDDAVRAGECLALVGLDYLVEHWGLDQPSEWTEHLSGGEMQRLGLARLLYHRQSFAFLDEATSALDVALERRCLQAVLDAGITPISVSMRATAHPFHAQLLTLHGGQRDGAWELKKLR